MHYNVCIIIYYITHVLYNIYINNILVVCFESLKNKIMDVNQDSSETIVNKGTHKQYSLASYLVKP